MLRVHGASTDPMSELIIDITTGLPKDASEEDLIKIFASDAEQLAANLHDNLPGGTLDRLLCVLLFVKASHMKAAFQRPTVTPPAATKETDPMNGKLKGILLDIVNRANVEIAEMTSEAEKAPTPNEKIRILITRDVLARIAKIFGAIAGG